MQRFWLLIDLLIIYYTYSTCFIMFSAQVTFVGRNAFLGLVSQPAVFPLRTAAVFSVDCPSGRFSAGSVKMALLLPGAETQQMKSDSG